MNIDANVEFPQLGALPGAIDVYAARFTHWVNTVRHEFCLRAVGSTTLLLVLCIALAVWYELYAFSLRLLFPFRILLQVLLLAQVAAVCMATGMLLAELLSLLL